MTKKYKLSFLPLFEEDLTEITDYISVNLHNLEAADRLVDDIEAEINKRMDAPLSFAPFHSAKHRPHPYYRINIRNFTVFYVVIEDTVEVRRVLYSKRDLDKLLDD